MDKDLVADTVAAERLGTTLRRAGYSEDAIQGLLGEDAYSSERGDTPAEERRLPDTPLATLVRLLFLQLPVSAEEAEAALGRDGVDALEVTGLAQVGDRIAPRARILPIGTVLLASDGFSRDGDDPADYVATYTPTARVLDSLTPRPRVYRDSEFSEEEVSERVILAAAERLPEGGYAAMLVSWLAFDENNPDERVLAWAEASGCESWVLSTMNSDPLTHAAEWNSHLVGEALGEALDEWSQYFDSLGVQLVSEGAVVLHKRPDGSHAARVDELDEDKLDDAGDQILRAFESRARLAELGSDNELLEARVGVASSLRLDRELEPSGGRAVDVDGKVELTEGTKHAVDASADVQEVVASLDSRMRLNEVIDSTADRLGLLDDEVGTLREESLDVITELLELGALRFRGD